VMQSDIVRFPRAGRGKILAWEQLRTTLPPSRSDVEDYGARAIK
jgi:hypothetical protein